MAHKDPDFDWSQVVRNSMKYPWDEWTDGSTWVIEHGVDFHRPPRKFIDSNLHGKASGLSMKVRALSFEEDGRTFIRFQFYKPEEANGDA
jgi:hypothetical protein